MEAQCETTLTIMKKSLQDNQMDGPPKNPSEMNRAHRDSALSLKLTAAVPNI